MGKCCFPVCLKEHVNHTCCLLQRSKLSRGSKYRPEVVKALPSLPTTCWSFTFLYEVPCCLAKHEGAVSWRLTVPSMGDAAPLVWPHFRWSVRTPEHSTANITWIKSSTVSPPPQNWDIFKKVIILELFVSVSELEGYECVLLISSSLLVLETS